MQHNSAHDGFSLASPTTLGSAALIATVALIVLPESVLGQDAQQPASRSFYTHRPEDPKAVYLDAAEFQAKGDGIADDSAALQSAINKVQETTRKGIVLIPDGRYRITKTIYVWNGIRLIGYGKRRPTMVLAEKTPGFAEAVSKYMLHFAGERPREAGGAIRDASPGTFYSACSNINLEIADGNPSAVGIRSHWAQHCFIAHCDFHIDNARAGVEQIGNEIDDCRFYGGDFGITTTKPSPSWPFLLIDSAFEGQRKAAIETEEGGLTIIRNTFAKLPTAVLVRENRAEELVMKDCRLFDISGPAVLVSDVANGRSQTNLVNVVCQNVPTLVKLRETGKTFDLSSIAEQAADSTASSSPAPASAIYRVENFTHGNQIADFGGVPEVRTTHKVAFLKELPDRIPSDIPPVPPVDTWASVLKYGAKGDGTTDETAALKKVIAENKAVYLPTGRYRVSETLTLKPDTILIGLSPFSTQILLADGEPAFNGEGDSKPLLASSKGGNNIVSGIGLDAGNNIRAIACKWMASANSLVNDVRFVGGHGTYNADGSSVPVYNRDRTGDGLRSRVWNSIPYSLWITDDGGGSFKDIWTPNPIAKAGFCVSDTSTSGRMYAISVEHHVANEVIFRNASNWEVFALQTEEERAEGPACLPLEITDCNNLQFNNFFFYRVNMPQPYIAGIKIRNSKNLVFRGLHTYSPGKTTYDNAVLDVASKARIRSREIARLDISGKATASSADARVAVIASGYENIDSLAIDSSGKVYYLDSRAQKIFRYDPVTKQISTLKDTPANPASIIFDTADNLLVFSGRGVVDALTFEGETTKTTSVPVAALPETIPATAKAFIHPQTRWRDAHNFLTVTQEFGNMLGGGFRGGPLTPPGVHHAPDGATLIPQTRDLTRAYALALAVPGQACYIADEFGQKTYRFTTLPNGKLAKPELVAEEGECGVVADAQGRVYVAAGEVFVYDAQGKRLEVIKVPERPTSLALSKDGKSLYIAARTSLYSVEIK